MQINIKLLLSVITFFALSFTCYAQAPDANQILQTWRGFTDTKPVVRNVTVTSVSKYDKDNIISTFVETFILAMHGDKFYLKRTSSSVKTTIPIIAQNDVYRFLLIKTGEQSEWNLENFQMLNEECDPMFSVYSTISAFTYGSHIDPFKTLSQLSRDQTFSLGKTSQIDDHTIVEYQYDLVHQNVKYPFHGELTLNANNRPVKITKFGPQGLTEEVVKTYSDDGYCSKIIDTNSGDGFRDVKTIEFSKADIALPEDSEFQLSFYGHPEPMGEVVSKPEPRQSSLWIWFAAGATCFVAIAICLRRVSR